MMEVNCAGAQPRQASGDVASGGEAASGDAASGGEAASGDAASGGGLTSRW